MLHNVIFLHINQNTKYISQKTGGQELVGWDAFLPGEKMSSSEMMVLWTYPFTLSLRCVSFKIAWMHKTLPEDEWPPQPRSPMKKAQMCNSKLAKSNYSQEGTTSALLSSKTIFSGREANGVQISKARESKKYSHFPKTHFRFIANGARRSETHPFPPFSASKRESIVNLGAASRPRTSKLRKCAKKETV